MSNKTLTIILVVLAGIFFANKLLQSNKNRSFDPVLVDFDRNEVSAIEFLNPQEEPFTVQKSGDTWMVKKGAEEYPADATSIEQVLNELSKIQVDKVVARTKEKAASYEADEEKGSRIIAKKGNKTLADITLGRFSFNQQTRQPISYVKKTKDEEVYLVNSFLAMSLKKDIGALRDKTFTNFSTEEIESLKLMMKDETVGINENSGQWMANNITLDSLQFAEYLKDIASLSGTTFAESIDYGKDISHSLEIVLSKGDIVTIDAREIDENAYQMQSSSHENNIFESNESGLYNKVFGKLQELLEVDE